MPITDAERLAQPVPVQRQERQRHQKLYELDHPAEPRRRWHFRIDLKVRGVSGVKTVRNTSVSDRSSTSRSAITRWARRSRPGSSRRASTRSPRRIRHHTLAGGPRQQWHCRRQCRQHWPAVRHVHQDHWRTERRPAGARHASTTTTSAGYGRMFSIWRKGRRQSVDRLESQVARHEVLPVADHRAPGLYGFGIPLWDTNTVDVTLTFPPEAHTARLLYCGLGNDAVAGGWRQYFPADAYPDRIAPSDEVLFPALVTGLLTIGVNFFALTADIGHRSRLGHDTQVSLPVTRVAMPSSSRSMPPSRRSQRVRRP